MATCYGIRLWLIDWPWAHPSQQIQEDCLRRTSRPQTFGFLVDRGQWLWVHLPLPPDSSTFTKSLLFLPPSSANCQVHVSELNDSPEKLRSRCCLEFYSKCTATQRESEALLERPGWWRMPTGCAHRPFLWNLDALNPLLREDRPAGRTGQCGACVHRFYGLALGRSAGLCWGMH